jgi:hypothetical protein
VGGITLGEPAFGGRAVLVILPNPNPEEIDDLGLLYRKPYEIPETKRRREQEETVR